MADLTREDVERLARDWNYGTVPGRLCRALRAAWAERQGAHDAYVDQCEEVERLRDEVARLRAENERLRDNKDLRERLIAETKLLNSAATENTHLRAALEPFAQYADLLSGVPDDARLDPAQPNGPRYGHCRAAREALEQKP